ncbi:uncharacterized protein Nplp1 isoform X2 [Hetaerina americana]|uniref:uncharacterized protein Nplp1 isoform X2 n=1 Tax=Hetaerina americana TaxID=62018 RepID=UPI003A7F3090
MVRSTAGRWSGKAAALFVLAAVQVVLADGHQLTTNTQTPQVTSTETPNYETATSNINHGIQKRSVSILARNGDLPYFRKEWNKKLHPGFRGMNVDDKDEESVPTKRYVGSLARGGGYPMGQGKRAIGSRYDVLDGAIPEDELLETYIPEDWSRGDMSEFAEDKRGGISSLAKAKGFVTYRGQYANGKRSVSALARSGELLSIGRGSSQERDGSGSSASKRGLGSILRNGGISTMGKAPVYSMSSSMNGKRGIESLARNYALPSMINQEYGGKFDLPEGELEGDSDPMTEALYEETEPIDDSDEPREMETSELIAKRHLGSFVRAYGFKPGNKRNIGSILRNGGGFSYNGKKSEEFSPYEDYSISNDKRHFSSLLKNHVAYAPYKRGTEEGEEYDGVDKRHLASILHGRNAFTTGKRYLGSIARQGLLGSRQEKREDMEWGRDEGPWSRGDSSLGKRSIAEGDNGSLIGETSFDRQDNSRVTNETAEDELKNAAGALSSGGLQKRSTGQGRGEATKLKEESSKRRQRRSLAVPYSSSDEYPMPVLQNTDFYDLGNTEEEELEGSPGKRFMVSPHRDPGRWRRSGGDAARGQRQPRVAGAGGRHVPAP